MFRRRRKVYVDDLDRPHDIRFFLIFVLAFAGLAAAVYGVGYLVTRDTVPSDTTVAGVDIGGDTRDEAEHALRSRVASRLDRPLRVDVGDRRMTLVPSDFGLDVHVDATLDAAMGGGDLDPRHMLAVLTGGSRVDPVITVDPSGKERGLSQLRRRVETKPVSFRVSFRAGRPVLLPGRVGMDVDDSGVVEALRRRLESPGRPDEPLRLPVRHTRPEVTWEEASRFADGVGARAVASPVTLEVAGRKAPVQTRLLSATLGTEVAGGRLRLVGNGSLLLRWMPYLERLAGEPKDAGLAIRRGRPVVVPGRNGQSASPDEWGEALVRAATSRTRRAPVRTRLVAPQITQDELRKLGLRRIISLSRVPIPTGLSVPRVRELARRATGAVVSGERRVSVVGRLGGLASGPEANLVASGVFDAALKAGLEVPTWAATDTAGLPTADGRRVWVGPNGPDLVLATRSPHGAYVRAYVSGSQGRAALHVQIWSSVFWQTTVATGPRTFVVPAQTRGGSGATCRQRPALDGYRVILRRTRVHGGQRLTDQFISAYRAQDGIRCGARR